MASQYDVTIIGGGIVGLATALKILDAYPRTKLLILEKEAQLARHQTGNNSGVIHSGLYYRPGSLKARSCVTGRKALIEFCNENSVPYELCGKVVVATSQEELPRLDELHRRGVANGLQGLEIIGTERLKELEPHAIGIKGLRVPETGIIDYKKVARLTPPGCGRRAVIFACRKRFSGLSGPSRNRFANLGGDYRTNYLINCCGLHSDIVAKMMKTLNVAGNGDEHRIIPFRGEYYKITRKTVLVQFDLPVPDPTFPFLEFTSPAWRRAESKPDPTQFLLSPARATIIPISISEICGDRFFQGLLGDGGEILGNRIRRALRSLNKPAFVRALQKLVPEIRESDLVPGGAGVRAQAVSASGALVDDFVIKESRNAIHVLNAPYPRRNRLLGHRPSDYRHGGKEF